MSPEQFYSIWNQAPWIQFDQDHTERSFVPTTLYSVNQEQEITGLKDITQKEPSWSILF